MTIYLVVGSTGYYPEDSVRWNVKAFTTEAQADSWATLAQRASEDMLEAADGIFYEVKGENPYDPRMQMIDGIASYSVEEIELE